MTPFLRKSLVLAATFFAAGAAAQTYPSKPIHLIVPFPPGGSVDVVARAISPKLGEALGQPLIVENRSGASGNIGTEAAAKAVPDGHTLLLNTLPFVVNPHLYPKVPYHPVNDFAPIGLVSSSPSLLVVHPSVPAKSVKELLDLARAQPGKLAMATPSAGTTNHLLSEFLQGITGTSWLTVHYKGNAPATTAMLAGEVQMGFDQVSVALPYIRQGKMRALATTTDKRVASLPDVPTFAEAGVNNMEAATFTAIVAPIATPKEVVARLSEVLAKVLVDRTVIERFDGIGAEARHTAPEALAAYFRAEYQKWTPVIQKADIKAN